MSGGQAGSLPTIDNLALNQKSLEDPFRTQLTQNTCGAACGVEVLKDVGVDSSMTLVAKLSRLNQGRTGIVTDNLVDGLNSIAGKQVFRGGSIDATAGNLNALAKSNNRFIALLDPEGAGHFVVVDGVNSKGLVNVLDPRGL